MFSNVFSLSHNTSLTWSVISCHSMVSVYGLMKYHLKIPFYTRLSYDKIRSANFCGRKDDHVVERFEVFFKLVFRTKSGVAKRICTPLEFLKKET